MPPHDEKGSNVERFRAGTAEITLKPLPLRSGVLITRCPDILQDGALEGDASVGRRPRVPP